MKFKFISIIILILLIIPTLVLASDRVGLYLWKYEKLINQSDEYINTITSEVVAYDKSVTEIYLAAYHGDFESYKDNYSELIGRFHDEGIKVYMTIGYYDWVIPDTFSWIKTNYLDIYKVSTAHFQMIYHSSFQAAFL